MKYVEVNGEAVCACDPSCDNCERRFRCLDAGVPLPKDALTGKVAKGILLDRCEKAMKRLKADLAEAESALGLLKG